MSLRVPHETVERTAQALPAGAFDLDWLATIIREANQPVPMQELARQAVRSAVVDDDQVRAYAAGRRYRRGERVRLLDGRLGDVVAIDEGENAAQGRFKIITLRLREGGAVRLAAEVPGAPQKTTPRLISAGTVEALLAGREEDIVKRVRQALASDPRFITLYYSDGEYGCLREFFPPMSPDVLDAALALLLDALFDQIPISRVTAPPEADGVQHVFESPSTEMLFSEHHLDVTLSTHPEWDDQARAAFEKARSLWSHAVQVADTWNARQMAHGLVQPLLQGLGWASVPWPAEPASREGVYALCDDAAAAAEFYSRYEPEEADVRWVRSLAQATSWGQPLDGPVERPGDRGSGEDERQSPTASVPSHRVVGTLGQTGVRWGILTNGKIWRLYSQGTNSLARTFYDIDLGAVFDELPPGNTPGPAQWRAFKHWWLLFGRDSYIPQGDGRCLLERLRERSPQRERKAMRLLRERLVVDVLPAVAGGFLAYRHQRGGVCEETPATVAQIHRAVALLITRLLFVLVAEARNLLPLKDPDYRPHSLTAQARWASERVGKQLSLNAGTYTTPRYDLIIALLRRISRGDSQKGIPCYGRLFFDPAENPEHAFLEETRLSDRAVALALDALTEGVDYSSLDARDLMGACGVLLRSRLVVSDAERGTVKVVDEDDSHGQIALLPDYVVTSSVEQALAPVLQARGTAFEEAMEQVVRLRGELRKALDRQKRASLYAEWEAAARAAREVFLGIRILDPAMGTGDFVLSAVDVLVDGIIEQLQAYHSTHQELPRDWNPIYRLIDEVRQDIFDEMDRQGDGRGGKHLDDATLLSRLVAQHCVFGVARSSVAVEIAKAGFWLHTFAYGAPLSFLEHHLRAGDALIGAELVGLEGMVEETEIASGFLNAVSNLYPLTERVDTTPLDVRWSAGQFERVRESLGSHQMLLHLVASAGLGDEEARQVLTALDVGGWAEDVKKLAPAWVSAQAAAEGFFHWELEFPEIFVDLATGTWEEQPGFDVVLGNPPWVTVADEATQRFLKARFDAGADRFDVHHAYLALARRLVRRPGGRTAYVLSREWLTTPTGGI